MTAVEQEMKAGQKMPDCTVHAGISPDSGKAMYATPADAPVTYAFNEAAKYATQLNAQNFLGHDDWRVPSKGELNVLFDNRAAIGGFDTSDFGWYWSSLKEDREGNTECLVWDKRFSDGVLHGNFEDNVSSLRCVRG